MYEIPEDILEEMKESRGERSYLKYISQGGRLTEMEFEKVLEYQPTEADMNKITALFHSMSLEDKILVAKIYHVISERKICLLTDYEVYCEYLAFTDKLKSFYEARLAEEKEKK